MQQQKNKSWLFCWLTLMAWVMALGSVQSADLSYELTEVISGETPSGPPPWARVTYSPVDGDTVRVVVQNLASAPQALKGFVFNTHLLDDLVLEMVESGGGLIKEFLFMPDSIVRAGQVWDGWLGFDNPAFLGSGAHVAFNLSSSATLPVSTFEGVNSGFYSAGAHIIRIEDGQSAWIANNPIPEASTYAAVALIVATVAGIWYQHRNLATAKA